ncbi:MAG: tellurite resistance TerB family protein, partial [Candidatus Kariarchaeaceae archaeon]
SFFLKASIKPYKLIFDEWIPRHAANMKKSPDSANKAREIWEKLRMAAMQDGMITEEENNLISNIVLDVEAYSQMVEIALADGIIDNIEKVELFEGRIEILEKAYEIARQDHQITDDEKEILKTICKLVLNLAKHH